MFISKESNCTDSLFHISDFFYKGCDLYSNGFDLVFYCRLSLFTQKRFVCLFYNLKQYGWTLLTGNFCQKFPYRSLLFFYQTWVRSLATLVTNSLTHCLIDLIDVTLTFEDANSKLLDVVSVADINALECEDYRLVEIMKLMFGQEYEPEYFF